MLPFFLIFKMGDQLIPYLESFITERRKMLFDTIISYRTRYIAVVLEDIYQSHNASAVLRSCDCFGIQDVHILENRNEFEVNSEIALGADKWINLYKHTENSVKSIRLIAFLDKYFFKYDFVNVIVTVSHRLYY